LNWTKIQVLITTSKLTDLAHGTTPTLITLLAQYLRQQLLNEKFF
jgi:hypothetical protein